MTELALATVETDLDGALALASQALQWTEAHAQPLLASASFTTHALVLGSLQRADTLRGRSGARFDVPLVRRRSTGTEAQLQGAVLYHALTLPHIDTLFSDATARTLLNRNLRSLLRGYTAAGVPFRYFGTEVLALLGHPVALIGYDQLASGAVLIEVLIGLENPCVVRPALRREPPAALWPLLRTEHEPHDFLQRAVAGIVSKLELPTFDVTASLAAPVVAPFNEGSPLAPQTLGVVAGSVPVPLGVVEAAVEPAPRITGDLLVGRAALTGFEQRAADAFARGEPPSSDLLAAFDGAPLDGARPADLLQALLQAAKL